MLFRSQPRSSHSSSEAEIVAIDEATREAAYLTKFLDIFDRSCLPLFIATDSTGAISFATNSGLAPAHRHMRARYFYVRECIGRRDIDLGHIAGAKNPADMMTKPIPFEAYNNARKDIGLFDWDDIQFHSLD